MTVVNTWFPAKRKLRNARITRSASKMRAYNLTQVVRLLCVRCVWLGKRPVSPVHPAWYGRVYLVLLYRPAGQAVAACL